MIVEPVLYGFAMTIRLLVTCSFLLAASLATAANTPRSGKKGGIDHCQGKTFICRDGSVSKSKKNCQGTMGSVGLLGSQASGMQPAAGDDCSCRSGTFCTGPRGGRYCVEDGGDKS